MDSGQPAPVVVEPPAPLPRERRLLASPLHTIFLVVLLIFFSWMGANTTHTWADQFGRPGFYALTVIWEWLLVGYVWLGIRRRERLRDLIGGRWRSVEDALLDIVVAIGFWFVSAAILFVLGYALGLAHPQQVEEVKRRIGPVIPKSDWETALWLVLSATAGFCEEIIFRGYLQRQFGAMAGHIRWGILAQAVLFGLSHGYEGPRRMLQIGVYGALFGVLAFLRRSLRPGMIAHFAQDTLAGIAARFILK